MDNHLIRQKILRYLEDANPAPAKSVDIAMRMPLVGLTQDQKAALVTTEATVLVTHGHIENLKAKNPMAVPLYRITAKGLSQISQETDALNPVVWGDLAYC